MPNTRIATTRARDFQPLGATGQPVVAVWGALVGLLSQRLSAEHAALLAEPVVNPSRGETDWYSDYEGPAVALSDLPDPARAAARAELARLCDDIVALAQNLRASRKDDERLLGAMLDLAVQVPDESAVLVQEGHPVLTAWGHVRTGPGAAPVVLTGARHRVLPPMAILPPPVAAGLQMRRRGWLAWWLATLLALLVLLAVLGLLFFDPFGWKAFGVISCAVPGEDLALRAQVQQEARREADLRTTLAELARQAGQRRAQCPAPPPPPAPPSSDEQRAQARGARAGQLQIILAWDDRNDLDLEVTCPGGRETISYQHKNGCGGFLDIDANGDAPNISATPVEHVTFAAPAPGRYRVMVNAYKMRVSYDSPFRVTVKRTGQPDQVIRGSAHINQRQAVTVVEVPAP